MLSLPFLFSFFIFSVSPKPFFIFSHMMIKLLAAIHSSGRLLQNCSFWGVSFRFFSTVDTGKNQERTKPQQRKRHGNASKRIISNTNLAMSLQWLDGWTAHDNQHDSLYDYLWICCLFPAIHNRWQDFGLQSGPLALRPTLEPNDQKSMLGTRVYVCYTDVSTAPCTKKVYSKTIKAWYKPWPLTRQLANVTRYHLSLMYIPYTVP